VRANRSPCSSTSNKNTELKRRDRGLYRRCERRARRPPSHVDLADPQIFRGHLAAVFLLFITDLGTFIKGAQTGPFHCRDVHENIFAAVGGLNKSISLGRVEPLHSPYSHCRYPPKKERSNSRDSSAKPVATLWQKAVALRIERRQVAWDRSPEPWLPAALQSAHGLS